MGTVASPAVDSNGWSYLPSGMILQWGSGAGSATVNFSRAFPTRCIVAVITPRSNASGLTASNNGMTANQLTVVASGGFLWDYIAIGF